MHTRPRFEFKLKPGGRLQEEGHPATQPVAHPKGPSGPIWVDGIAKHKQIPHRPAPRTRQNRKTGQPSCRLDGCGPHLNEFYRNFALLSLKPYNPILVHAYNPILVHAYNPILVDANGVIRAYNPILVRPRRFLRRLVSRIFTSTRAVTNL